MNQATNTFVSGLKCANRASTQTILLNGTINNLAHNTSQTFNLTGFDSNFASANSGQGITVRPGVYEAHINVTFTQPTTSGASAWCSLSVNVTGTNAVANPSNYQTNAVFNGWPANNTSALNTTSDLYMPSGGTVSFGMYQFLGANISTANLKVTLKQTKAY